MAARYLSDWGALPHLFLLNRPRSLRLHFQATQERRIPITLAGDSTYLPALQHALGQGEAVLDGVLGIGSERPLEGIFKETLELVRQGKVQRPSLQLIAVDVPTGWAQTPALPTPAPFPQILLSPSVRLSAASLHFPAQLWWGDCLTRTLVYRRNGALTFP